MVESVQKIKRCAIVAALFLAFAGEAAQSARAADPIPPSIALAPLFERVALSGIFADGKTWADATPNESPGAILGDFRSAPPKTDVDLRSFVNAHFVIPAEVNPVQPPKGLPLRAHIASLWPILTRTARSTPEYSSLLPLPNPYVVPGGRFREIYYWDSYFTMLGMGGGQAAVRRGMVDDFAYLIRTYGHIPNGNRTYYLSRSQPPFFFEMVELTDAHHPARADARYLRELRTEYAWWMKGVVRARVGYPVARVVRLPGGAILNRYWDDRDTPRDESYLADVKIGGATADPPATYRNIRAAAESGWDFSSRWLADGKSLATIRTTDIVPPDLNSLLYGLERAIARGCAEEKDQACASTMRAKAAARAKAIRKYLWNPATGVFDDYDWRAGQLIGNVSAAALYPLFVSIATKQQAVRVADVAARQLVRQGGMVTTDHSTGQQWDSPNGWAPLQWIAVNGLRHYGQNALAEEIASRWLATISRVYGNTGKLLEKYDVVTRRPGGGGEYPLQDGFGWTNGVTEGLLGLYPTLETPRPVPTSRTSGRVSS